MQTIIDNGAYSERVTITPIDALKDQFRIKIESQAKGAKNPDAWRNVYNGIVDKSALERFGKEIYDAATGGSA